MRRTIDNVEKASLPRCVKCCTLSEGQKNLVAVIPNADLDKYIQSIISSISGNAGQRSLVGSNLVLVGKTHRDLWFIAVGKPLHPGL